MVAIIHGMIHCGGCSRPMALRIAICVHCEWKNPYAGMTEEEVSEIGSEKRKLSTARDSGDWSEVPLDVIQRKAANIILTTSFFVAQREIEKEIEVLTAECVYGMNIFKDFLAGVRDIFGGRSAATQKVLRDARVTVLGELKREALMVGADAVIGIDIDYQELSGGGKLGMLMIVASGTAVKLKPIEEADASS